MADMKTLTIGGKTYTVHDATARSAASNAQTTANNAATAAVNAQGTADTAKSNAATAQTTANEAKTAAATAQSTANAAQTAANSKAPMYTYGTTDLTAGTSPLETGKLYFVYEAGSSSSGPNAGQGGT